MEQLGLELVPIWNVGITGVSLTHCATVLALRWKVLEGVSGSIEVSSCIKWIAVRSDVGRCLEELVIDACGKIFWEDGTARVMVLGCLGSRSS